MKLDLSKYSKNSALLFDGAMGTMLMGAGLPAGELPEKWNLDRPEIIKSIHSLYYHAGSGLVITNTFGANNIKLSGKLTYHEIAELNRKGAEIAREACPAGKFVAGDIGPTGKITPPFGTVPIEAIEKAFCQQAAALIEGEVDAIIIETMYSLDEALAALRAVKRAGLDVPVIVSLTYRKTPKGYHTIMGDEAMSSTRILTEVGADAVGANCTLESADMIGLTTRLRAATGLPVIIQPNAGKPQIDKGTTYYTQSPEVFAADICRIVEAGASIVGGCCGTTPEFIHATAIALGDRVT